jgi:hypothetical protein
MGVALCHRASCGWKGNHVKLISAYLKTDVEEAKNLISGGVQESLASLINLLEEDKSTKNEILTISDKVWIENSTRITIQNCPMEIEKWLTMTREYDPAEFLKVHAVYLPPAGLYQGRVIFKVSSDNVEAYQLYDYTGLLERKTLNPSREFLSRTLYNYENVKDKDEIIIHEGIFDVARSIERGYSPVCVFGTNISEYQTYLLSKTEAKEIIICLDADANVKSKNSDNSKSFNMSKKLTEKIKDKIISIMYLPKGDPDDIGGEEFRRAYDQRKQFSRRTIFDLL